MTRVAFVLLSLSTLALLISNVYTARLADEWHEYALRLAQESLLCVPLRRAPSPRPDAVMLRVERGGPLMRR